jgi:SAM-dependent methyltransferase
MNAEEMFDNFLKFETDVFGEDFPIAHYDPYMIRYGEYRFVFESLDFSPGDVILDLGCEANILILYLAYLGGKMVGVDVDRKSLRELRKKKKFVEDATGRQLDITFKAQDATNLRLKAESVDKAVSISAIEHMYSKKGHGDQLAVDGLARVLKPGGLGIITVPMSNGNPFHEAPQGDAQFAGPYRLYTPEALQERLLSNPAMEPARVNYLAQTTPDPRYPNLHFFRFWMNTLTQEERLKWAWANPILVRVFNPIVSQEEGMTRLETVNTALVCLRKKG